MVNVAMIGFGGIAQAAHLPAYLNLEKEGKARLVAVCDIDEKRFTQKLEINIGGSDTEAGDDIHKYTDWREMLKNEKVDMVDICLPTFLHAPLATEFLAMGYNVLSEKPMALSFEDASAMCAAAEKTGKKLMIGQCLRFSNQYNFIKKAVDENTFGKAMSGTFRRMSSPPLWSWENWYMTYERSHGCMLDMHIHDIDMVRYLFGEPKTVSCVSQGFKEYSGKDIIYSTLNYDGFSMLAIGDWSQQGLPFTADCRVAFEKATVDLGADGITVYPREGEAYKPELEGNDMYQSEIEFFIDMLENGTENTANPPESAAMTVKLIDTLCKSSENGGKQIAFD